MNMNSQTCLAAKTGYSPGMVTKAIASLKYYWLVRVHPDGKSEMQIMLSNDNLVSVNSSESPVRFPMP
jgi:hypothetical protein